MKDEWTSMIIYSFNTYVKVYCVPDSPLNIGNKAVIEIESVPPLTENLDCLEQWMEHNRHLKIFE